MSLIEVAAQFEAAKQRAEYWHCRWKDEGQRKNDRFMIRWIRALRICERLDKQLRKP